MECPHEDEIDDRFYSPEEILSTIEDTPNWVSIPVTISPELHQKLVEESNEANCNFNDWVVQLLKTGLEDEFEIN